MTLQNVTVSLPEELLQEAKHLAVDEGLSLSRFVARSLEQRVEARRTFHAARARQLKLLNVGLPLGTGGRIAWKRDDLYER